MTTRDIHQKLTLAKLLWAWGYVPHIEVRITHPEASAPRRYELTDIDVYGVRATLDFSMERVVGDCKTLRNVSPINRTFWLKGVMEYLGVHRGYLVLRTSRPITEDHKLSARAMGVALMSEDDFRVFQSKLLPEDFPQEMMLFREESWQYLEGNIAHIGQLDQLNEYRTYRYWLDSPPRALRYSLLETRTARDSIDPRDKLQRALILEMVTLFSIAFLDMLCHLFHIYLIPERKSDLDTYLKAYVYGGREYYAHLNQLTRSLQRLRADYAGSGEGEQPIADLSLPEWERFLQLFRTVLEHPIQFRDTARFLRFLLFERLLYENRQVKLTDALPATTTHTIKLAMDITDYFLRASGLYDGLWQPLSKLMIAALAELQGVKEPEEVRLIESVKEAREPVASKAREGASDSGKATSSPSHLDTPKQGRLLPEA